MNPLIGPFVGWAVLIAVLGLACWKGGRTERYGAAIVFVGAAYALIVNFTAPKDLVPVLLLVGEGAMGAGFLYLALRHMSAWLGVAMLLQAIQFSLHAYYLVGDLPRDKTYATINNLDSMGVLLCILIGTVLAWRSRAKAAK